MGMEVEAAFFSMPQQVVLLPPQQQRHNQQYETLGQGWLWDVPQPSTAASSTITTASTKQQPSLTSNSKTASLKRKPSSARLGNLLRKSYSEKPLSDSVLSARSSSGGGSSIRLSNGGTSRPDTSASLQSVYDCDENNYFANEQVDAQVITRRQAIMDRAEQILKGKRHVGMQVGAICPVCLMDDVDTQLTNCGHLIHAKCIKRWIQSGTRCPVCREEVTDVEENFTAPASLHMHMLEKDHVDLSSSSDNSTEEQEHYEWGWFEDFDDCEDNNTDDGFIFSSRRSLPTFPSSNHGSTHQLQPLMKRELSSTFTVCRTFPPLRADYDMLYSESKYTWMHSLPSHRHIAAKIQIRSFRIVEAKDSKAQHAEYLVELQLDGKYFSRWKRFSSIVRFVGTLGTSQFRQTLTAWTRLEASSRWFNRLELGYLHRRCKLLEEFAHTLLVESTTAHHLADLLAC